MKRFWKIPAALGVVGAASLAWAQADNLNKREQTPGAVIEIAATTLAKPYATPSRANVSNDKPRAGQMPTVPAGFLVNVFASGLGHARNMFVAANGDVLLAEQRPGKITLLRDADGDGKAELTQTFAEGFKIVYGLAAGKDALYVGDADGIWRIPYTPGDTKARAPQERISADGAFGGGGGHVTRNVTLAPDGSKIYVSIGSRGNIAEEEEQRATIQEFALEGGKAVKQRTFASGLRNAVGTAFYPGTDTLYTVVNERDGLGDELVPDYLTSVKDGGFYGWPYSYLGQNPQPGFAEKKPDLVKKAIVPDVLFRSHSAPLGLAFYTGTSFPAEYQGGAFVALHGSWNAEKPRAYHVAFVPFKGGKPAANSYKVFASGFWTGADKPEVWGRPAGVAVAKDGSLLIADDGSQTIFRVSAVK
ncbi:MAG: PQQ-dependent sugar dehydrogenase [Proteobacteria bacterium]|nr:PQQ-dependent sugar dehydrogenase [Pseudomonadota bacterium]